MLFLTTTAHRNIQWLNIAAGRKSIIYTTWNGGCKNIKINLIIITFQNNVFFYQDCCACRFNDGF